VDQLDADIDKAAMKMIELKIGHENNRVEDRPFQGDAGQSRAMAGYMERGTVPQNS
jgi:hypothetical protein